MAVAMKIPVFCAITPCSSETLRRFGGSYHLLSPACAGFFPDVLVDPEYGGDEFVRNVGLSPNYTVFQPRKPYSTRHPLLLWNQWRVLENEVMDPRVSLRAGN
jgi:hypothetical protein